MKPGKSNYGKLVRYNISLNLTALGQTKALRGTRLRLLLRVPLTRRGFLLFEPQVSSVVRKNHEGQPIDTQFAL